MLDFFHNIIDDINMNVVIAILIVVSISLFLKYIMPKVKNINKNIYDEVSLALQLTEAVYKDEDIKRIIDFIINIIESLDNIDETEEINQPDTIAALTQTVIDELDIEVNKETIELIVRIVMSYL